MILEVTKVSGTEGVKRIQSIFPLITFLPLSLYLSNMRNFCINSYFDGYTNPLKYIAVTFVETKDQLFRSSYRPSQQGTVW